MNILRARPLFRAVAVSVLILSGQPAWVPLTFAAHTPTPETVAIPGTLQSELGCSGDWQPECDKTFLTYDPEDDVWQGTFTVQPNDDQDKNGPRYKAALNKSWAENYGANAQPNGPDIPLVVTTPTEVKFYYDHKTHWVAEDFNNLIIAAVGDFQQQLGCANNNDAGCLRSWLQDPDGDGVYAFATAALPPGQYQVRLAFDESNDAVTEPQPFEVKQSNQEIYFGYNAETKEMTLSTEGAPRGSLSKARAHWVTRDTFLWNIVGSPKYSYALYYSPDASLKLTAAGVEGGAEIPLTFAQAGPGGEVFKKFPHLAGYSTFKLDPSALPQVPNILKAQIALLARDANGNIVDAASVQLPGALDDLYHYDGPLGVSWENGTPALRVWAPTAKSVSLHLFDSSTDSSPNVSRLTFDVASGVWAVTGQPDWKNKFYLYEVEVYVPQTGRIEQNLVTDPYSLSLAINSTRSQIVDLADPALKPDGWDSLAKPPLAAPEDSVIYELHIRDFSANDPAVPEELRGTFKAFTVKNSNGMKHLKALAEAGLTHIHLLPAFDIATIEEDRSQWQTIPDAELAALPPDSDGQQLLLAPFRDADGFNWGYDPYHYTVPEGSYSTDPDGPARIKEFREMVQSLNEIGLRAVMDVVYNHTTASGQDARSVLDKIVPGYYHRLNKDGGVESSTCCENTATEHRLMEKLMIDSVTTWATAYKVDGFRFDLMGHHLLSNMTTLRAQLDALTPEQGGVDGKAIYVYGEGWDFGEVQDNARGVNATQLNIGGAGIGVFNDRLRDGVRGGTPFSAPTEQGFATGLYLDSNDYEQRETADQKEQLLEYMDWIRAGLAGNLADYEFVRANGDLQPAKGILYGNDPAGYTRDPQENIVYVSAHDNETLFDAIQLKASATASLADRVRMNNLALDLVMLSQGVPFFHAGDDLLRSKSLDRNSYNSGDWFNKLDFTYQSNNFGVGLPAEGRSHWDVMRPLLADPDLKPAPADIQFAAEHFQTMLRVRKSSPLFRLRTADQVKRAITFLNTGPDQLPGLLVMQLADVDAFDPNLASLLVLFNAGPKPITFTDASLKGAAFQPYAPLFDNSTDPALADSAFDSATGAFTIPARTTVIYALAESGQSPSAPTAAAQPTPATPTPMPQPSLADYFTLNAVAVGFLILSLVGLFGMLRSRPTPPEEPAPKKGKKKSARRK